MPSACTWLASFLLPRSKLPLFWFPCIRMGLQAQGWKWCSETGTSVCASGSSFCYQWAAAGSAGSGIRPLSHCCLAVLRMQLSMQLGAYIVGTARVPVAKVGVAAVADACVLVS